MLRESQCHHTYASSFSLASRWFWKWSKDLSPDLLAFSDDPSCYELSAGIKWWRYVLQHMHDRKVSLRCVSVCLLEELQECFRIRFLEWLYYSSAEIVIARTSRSCRKHQHRSTQTFERNRRIKHSSTKQKLNGGQLCNLKHQEHFKKYLGELIKIK